MRRCGTGRWVTFAGMSAVATLLAAAGPSRADVGEIPSGTILGKDNCQIAKGALPDEILEFYCRGDYENPIRKGDGIPGRFDNPRLAEISEKNYGKYDVNESGTLIDPATGARPPVLAGFPFKIDPKDPKAGSKAMWNYFYSTYWEGGFHTNSPVNWIDRDQGRQRRISVDVHFKYYDGAPPEIQERIKANPLNLLSRTLGLINEPADLNGIVALNWRYRDGNQKDNAWSYVPALRRVRMINPNNRADGLLGSDISEDDGPYFDGKPEDFEFKLVGETTLLAHFDGPGLDSDGSNISELPPGSKVSTLVTLKEPAWQLISPQPRAIWSDADGWKDDPKKLVAWAPIQTTLVPRKVWIIEAVPKDKYYLYGKQTLYLDQQTFRGYWKNKYDWKGQALANYMIPGTVWHEVNGAPGWVKGGGGGNVAVALNYKADRASVTGMPIAPVEYYVDIPDEIYEIDHLVRGK